MSAEIQLFSISCIVVYFYKKRPKIGLYLNLILLVIGAGHLFLVFYLNDIPAQMTIQPLDFEWVSARKFEKIPWPFTLMVMSQTKNIHVFLKLWILIEAEKKFQWSFLSQNLAYFRIYYTTTGGHLWSYMGTLLFVKIIFSRWDERVSKVLATRIRSYWDIL